MTRHAARGSTSRSRTNGQGKRRTLLFGAAFLFAGSDLAVKVWAQDTLQTASIDAWPIGLRLAYNPGVAFSLGTSAPVWLLLLVTAAITATVAVVGWRTAPTSGIWSRTALAAILGGATANLIDRAPDGLVTDYLHTGWWPTFNLADTFIVVGAISLVALDLFRKGEDDTTGRPADLGGVDNDSARSTT